MIKGVVFDMGGVLTVDNFDAVLKKVALDFGVPYEELSLLRKKHHANLTLGKYSIRQFVESLKQGFSLKLSVDELMEIWKKHYTGETPFIKDTFELSRKLKGKYSVGILSNLYDFHTQIMSERGLYKGFVPCIVSNQVGLAKPDSAIYKLYLKKAKLKAEDCVFIDDKEEFIFAAQKLGFKTILYKNHVQCVSELQAFEVELK